ncbi:uncharacterized protein BYT42DRAFT_54298 [Radiomyces spectabilis]|uniref:uncharacterized protein n=1 Tax=Radiomyces spectabilis TaxID=64574 RepID=UPI0022200BB4|nr:uncharacterized protein BYT42DRAFT_54298 [Radiomyces spectabilis]KAI8372984.1 hypothetical protein BYT42DRAFT_54298 [Radiomyces spectabilis]
MSNPVAESAQYFAQKEKQANGATPWSDKTSENVDNDDKPTPVEASHTRRCASLHKQPSRQSNRRRSMSFHSSSSSRNSDNFEPREKWHKVFDKLAAIGTIPDGGQRASFQRHRMDSHHKRDSQSDDSNDHDETYELSHTFRHRHGHRQGHPQVDPEDDVLPAPDEIEDRSLLRSEQDDRSAEEHNYFAHPYKEKDRVGAKPATTKEAAAPSVPTEQEGTPTSPTSAISPTSDQQARTQWDKTLDKVRLIAGIQTAQRPMKPVVTDDTTSLAPYFHPVFDPPFLALSKDEHGRKLLDITDSELLTQGINQWIFRIELQYGDIKWVIRKTIADFVGLHYTLKFKSNLSDYVPAPPPFPSQLSNWINSAKDTLRLDRDDESITEKERKEQALNRRKALTQYLRELLRRAHMLLSYDLCEFLEISAISIVQDMGWKGKEGYLDNRVNFVSQRLCNMLKPHRWTKEWVILRDSYIAFCSDIASQSPTDVFILDKNFTVTDRTPGLLGKYHHHIRLANKFRRIEIKGSKRQVEEWMEGILKVQQESPWCKNHRFGSFAPIRNHAKVKWFVDGEDHFNAVAEAILSAKSEIYIADWWLSPELYLRRPPEKNEEFRIDRLLQRKAQEGVMVYIIVYKEMSVALTINSAHTKQWLQNLHPNIIVQRHPDHRSIDNTVLFWSHHEKMVIVDNRLAFIGGLDLCWGRYDSHAHRLADHPAQGHKYTVWPGQDYSNPRVKDFLNVVRHDLTLVERQITPRMPWHDMTIGVVGPIARDIARHFVQRWNFLKASKGMHRSRMPFLMPKGEYVAARDETKFKGSCRVQLLRSSAQWSSGIAREHSIYNAYMECISKAKHFVYIENQFFISTTTQDKLLRNRISQAMVERIKRAHEKGEKFKIFILIPLIPAFEGDLASSDASAARNVMHFQYISISRGGNSIMEKLREAGIDPTDYIGWYCLRNWDKIIPRDEHIRTKKPSHPGSKTDSGTVFPDSDQASLGGNTAEQDYPPDSAEEKKVVESGSPFETSNDAEDDRRHYVSELVYIHDKLMIIDDRIVLVGSANINDR